jgi:hypothetical protein
MFTHTKMAYNFIIRVVCCIKIKNAALMVQPFIAVGEGIEPSRGS